MDLALFPGAEGTRLLMDHTLITRVLLLYPPPTFLDLLHPVLRLFLTLSHQAHTVGGKQQTESGGLRGRRERVLDLLDAGQGKVTPNFHLRESIDMCVHALMKPLAFVFFLFCIILFVFCFVYVSVNTPC